MKKIFAMIACIALMVTSLTFVGCFGSKGDPIEYTIRLNELNQYWVEYNNGRVYAKDGQFVFAQGNYYGDDVFIKENLSGEYFVVEPYGGQGYVTASWNDGWQIATNWNENDRNNSSVYQFFGGSGARLGIYSYLKYGYSDVNQYYENPSVTVTELEHDTLTVGAEEVECLVFDYVYDDGSTYGHHLYFYALDSHICLKALYSNDRDEDILADGSVELEATLYKVGVAMNTILTQKERTPAPDMSEYV